MNEQMNEEKMGGNLEKPKFSGYALSWGIGGSLLFVGLLTGFINLEFEEDNLLYSFFILVPLGFAVCVVTLALKMVSLRKRTKQQEEARRAEYYKILEEEGKSITRTIQVKNMEGTADYFTISKAHVRFSFGFSIFACIVGLAFLGIAVYRAMTDKSFESALIPTIGGAVAEFIAATVFWVHRKSAEQLNRYYDSLHEIEVFLSTTDMVNELSTPEKKDEAILMTLRRLYEVQSIKAAKPDKYVPSATKPTTKEG